MEYIELSATIRDYSYKNMIDCLKPALCQNKAAKLVGAAMSIGTHAMNDWFVKKTVNTKLIGTVITQTINKELGQFCQIEHISIKQKEDGSMEIKAELTDYKYEEIFGFISNLFVQSENVYLRELLPLCLQQFDETISDEQKNHLLAGILNNLPDSVLAEIAENIKKKTGITLKIVRLGCGVSGKE